jgi:spore coat polysaccharide biosynthesis protein SpsF (cytidylyltransferase family)
MIIGVLQARFSSLRLPGKVLKPILGKPMLSLQIERLLRANSLDKLIVATSDCPDDDPIAQVSSDINIECFRGSLDDVLDRYYRAVAPLSPSSIVRLTGDCPLCDPALIDEIVAFHLSGDYDYSSNTISPTYPDGLDVEVCRFSSLEIAHQEAIMPSQREHVTQFIHQQPKRFKLGNYQGSTDRSHLRWTVDEPEDFDLVNEIYESIYPTNPAFTTSDVLDWFDSNPLWYEKNNQFRRNEGLAKSLVEDREFKRSE